MAETSKPHIEFDLARKDHEDYSAFTIIVPSEFIGTEQRQKMKNGKRYEVRVAVSNADVPSPTSDNMLDRLKRWREHEQAILEKLQEFKADAEFIVNYQQELVMLDWSMDQIEVYQRIRNYCIEHTLESLEMLHEFDKGRQDAIKDIWQIIDMLTRKKELE